MSCCSARSCSSRGPCAVTSVTPTLGATVQPGPVLTITSIVRQVTIELDAAQQAEVKVGDPVTITLPDNRTTPGKVTYVGTVATIPASSSGQGGQGGTDRARRRSRSTSPRLDPAATGHLDQAPVDVSITTASVKDALVVPVAALLALGGGGYALEEIGSERRASPRRGRPRDLRRRRRPRPGDAVPVSLPASASWCRANERRARARGGDQVVSGRAAGHGAGRGELQRSTAASWSRSSARRARGSRRCCT